MSIKLLGVGDVVKVVAGVHASKEGIVRNRTSDTRNGSLLFVQEISGYISLPGSSRVQKIFDGKKFWVEATRCNLSK